MNSLRESSQESGFYLVLVAIMAMVLLGFCALVIGLGYLSTGKHFLQNATNFAALAALEEYVTNEHLPTHQDRINKARDRANQILAENKLMGTLSDLGEVNHPGQQGAGGEILFGAWHQENPGTSDPCNNNYPCFETITNPQPSSPVNAVRINVKNQSNNPLIAPFAHLFGDGQFFISAVSTAAIARRCGAFLIDVTRTTIGTTHRAHSTFGPNPKIADPNQTLDPEVNEPHRLVTSPEEVGFFAARTERLNKFEGTELVHCTTDDNVVINGQPVLLYANPDKTVWCNMGVYNYDESGEDPVWTSVRDDYYGPNQHFQSDFRSHPWPDDEGAGTIMVDSYFHSYDTYFGPQPMSTFFLSFNAALRLIRAQGSFGDLIRITGFAGESRASFPIPGDGEPVFFSPDLDMGIQLTNINNRGTHGADGAVIHPRVRPNFIDYGWVPLHLLEGIDANTYIAGSLLEAANIVGDQCPANTNKFIIMASDFKNTCSEDVSGFSCTDNNPEGYEHFVRARNAIVHGSTEVQSILETLQERRIAVTAITDGDHIRPHFINRLRPECETPLNPDHDCFITLEEAGAYSFGGYGSQESFFDNSHNLSDIPPAFCDVPGGTSDSCAFAFAGVAPGVVFGEALPLAARIAQDTGGFICPLMEVGEANLYVNAAGQNPGSGEGPYYLKPEYREVGQVQLISPEYISKAEQAARCGQRTVGTHPYVLVTEKPSGY